MKGSALVLGLVCSAGTQELPPAGRQPPPALGIVARVVRVDVVVTDKKGRPVAGLGPADFEVREEGRLQTLTHFAFIGRGGTAHSPWPPQAPTPNAPGRSPDEPAPKALLPATAPPTRSGRVLLFVVDDLSLASETLLNARPVLRELVGNLEPGDRAAIVRTSAPPTRLVLTAESKVLQDEVDGLRWSPRSERFKTIRPIEVGKIDMQRLPGYTLEFQREGFRVKDTLGVLDALVSALGALPDRKAVVLLSDSLKMEPVGRDLFTRLADTANRRSVVVYSLDARGVQSLNMAADDYVNIPGFQEIIRSELDGRGWEYDASQTGLRELAQATGGLFLGNTALPASLRRVLVDTGGYYLIGYIPEIRGTGAGRLRRVDVKLRTRGERVRARRAYFG